MEKHIDDEKTGIRYFCKVIITCLTSLSPVKKKASKLAYRSNEQYPQQSHRNRKHRFNLHLNDSSGRESKTSLPPSCDLWKPTFLQRTEEVD